MVEELEMCSCPLCGEDRVADKLYDFSPYKVVQCVACDLWYLNPRLTEEDMLAQYADDAYFEGSNGVDEGYGDYSEQEKSLRPTFLRLMQLLEQKKMTGGRLLEVGCGYGYLLDEASSYFDFRMGTDFSLAAVDKASAYANEIVHGGIDAVDDSQVFDCIVAMEVIEHIYDPVDFVEALFSHLKPGGWLILATPDMGSRWRSVMQSKWPSFKLPEHVTYYDSDTLGLLYDRCGFEEINKLPLPHVFPLSLLFEKLHLSKIPVPKLNVWIPSVVLVMAARRPL